MPRKPRGWFDNDDEEMMNEEARETAGSVPPCGPPRLTPDQLSAALAPEAWKKARKPVDLPTIMAILNTPEALEIAATDFAGLEPVSVDEVIECHELIEDGVPPFHFA